MKNWTKKLSGERLQRIIFVCLLVIVFAAFFISLSIASSEEPVKENPDSGQNNNDDNTPVKPNPTPTVEMFGMPISGEYEVVRKFYDPSASTSDQELAVIQFGKRYYTSNGISITNKTSTEFSVLASLSGTVSNIEESPIYGTIITLSHDNGVYTEYSSLSSTPLKVGDTVTQGAIIGTSGICEYDSSLASHVHFKVSKDKNSYNPETVVGTLISSFK